MNLFTVATTILGALYFLALVERLTLPLIYEDSEPIALDNINEQEWENSRDYFTAADHGFACESSWDF